MDSYVLDLALDPQPDGSFKASLTHTPNRAELARWFMQTSRHWLSLSASGLGLCPSPQQRSGLIGWCRAACVGIRGGVESNGGTSRGGLFQVVTGQSRPPWGGSL